MGAGVNDPDRDVDGSRGAHGRLQGVPQGLAPVRRQVGRRLDLDRQLVEIGRAVDEDAELDASFGQVRPQRQPASSSTPSSPIQTGSSAATRATGAWAMVAPEVPALAAWTEKHAKEKADRSS